MTCNDHHEMEPGLKFWTSGARFHSKFADALLALGFTPLVLTTQMCGCVMLEVVLTALKDP